MQHPGVRTSLEFENKNIIKQIYIFLKNTLRMFLN